MKKLIERQLVSENVKMVNRYQQLGKLLIALEEKGLPTETVDLINQEIEHLNSIAIPDKYFVKSVKEKENRIIQVVEKNHKIVPIHYYRKLWMIVGMSAFGVPIGLMFGLIAGNMGLLGVGFPIGMAIGIGVGSGMDKKALREGRQLDFEVKH